MTFLVTDACVKCKLTDCVIVCPVDCFYEGENFLAIHPDECIDCAVCVTECPIDAIVADTDDTPDGKWLAINTTYSAIWPRLTKMRPHTPDWEQFKGEEGKFEKYFSPAPGEGD